MAKNNGKNNKNVQDYKNRKSSNAQGSKKKNKKQSVAGFTTLNQVAGVPKRKQFHSDIPVEEAKKVAEPSGIICAICGNPITSIAEAFSVATGFVHFDCALERVKAEETLNENQTVSYIGSGNFGVCEKGEDGKYSIIKKIAFENSESNKKMKDYVEGLKQ